MTPTEQTFVDVVAREIWSRLREPGCQICGWAGRDDKTAKTHDSWADGFGLTSHTYEPRSEDPRTVDVLLAAKLLGMLEERNGASIEGIVDAASHKNTVVIVLEPFFRAIARESLGEGKVFDEYAEFKVGNPRFNTDRVFSVPRLNIEGAQL